MMLLRDRRWRPILTVLVYGGLGPLIGMFGLLVVFAVFSVFEGGEFGTLLIIPLAFVSPGVLMAYSLAFVPAFLTGVIMVIASFFLSYERQFLVAPIVGFIACYVWGTRVGGGSGMPQDDFMLSMTGAFAALVCCLAVKRYLSSNDDM